MSEFAKSAAKLSRSPLGIIALFQVLIEAIAGLVMLNLDAPVSNGHVLTILALFVCLFPCLVLAVFTYLVICHHDKLYGPSDFTNEDNFMALFEQGAKNSKHIAKIESIAREVRSAIDSHPLFMFAQLPVSVQGFLKNTYVDGQNSISNAAKKQGDAEGFRDSIQKVMDQYGWIEINDDTVLLSEKGKQELGSFIELCIPRFL